MLQRTKTREEELVDAIDAVKNMKKKIQEINKSKKNLDSNSSVDLSDEEVNVNNILTNELTPF